jgi:hypothetical protein
MLAIPPVPFFGEMIPSRRHFKQLVSVLLISRAAGELPAILGKLTIGCRAFHFWCDTTIAAKL